MNNLKELLKVKKYRLILIITLVLLIALPTVLYLVQTQQIFKPRASQTVSRSQIYTVPNILTPGDSSSIVRPESTTKLYSSVSSELLNLEGDGVCDINDENGDEEYSEFAYCASCGVEMWECYWNPSNVKPFGNYAGYCLGADVCGDGPGPTTCPGNSTLGSDNQCRCDSGYVLSGSSCIPGCTTNASLLNGQCYCDTGYVVSGNSCVLGNCPINSTRQNGQCYCNVGYVVSGGACILGTPTCTPNSTYIGNNQCQCNPGFIVSGTTCIQDSTCNFSCQANSGTFGNTQCGSSGGTCLGSGVCSCPGSGGNNCPVNSTLQNGQCICNTGFVPNSASTACVPSSSTCNASSSCQANTGVFGNTQCGSSGGTCLGNGVCSCPGTGGTGNSPSATLSAPGFNPAAGAAVGTPINFSANASGANLKSLAILRSKTGSPPSSAVDVARNTCNGSSCVLTGTWTPTVPNESWLVNVEVVADPNNTPNVIEAGEACSGFPGLSSPFVRCNVSGSDQLTVSVTNSGGGGIGSPAPSASVVNSGTACPILGDADDPCNNHVTGLDFQRWVEEFTGSRTTKRANFNPEVDDRVTGLDFQIWLAQFLRGI